MCEKCLGLVVIAWLAASGSLLGGGGKEAGEKELKKIQGTWRFIFQEMEGKPRPPKELVKLTITFTDDKWSVRDDGKVVQAGTHKLDPSKKPGHVDAVVTEGEGKGSTMLGIYELKGDKMKVVFDPQGKERPASFISRAGQFGGLIQWEKKKP
jgi:uncharacterized protein (TIGR03067 family)